jgi:hypothetical protein
MGGVYVQEIYDPANQTAPENTHYKKMTPCSTRASNAKLNVTGFDSYYCPDVDYIYLRGGLENRRGVRQTNTFGFKVFTCPVMNTLKEKNP